MRVCDVQRRAARPPRAILNGGGPARRPPGRASPTGMLQSVMLTLCIGLSRRAGRPGRTPPPTPTVPPPPPSAPASPESPVTRQVTSVLFFTSEVATTAPGGAQQDGAAVRDVQYVKNVAAGDDDPSPAPPLLPWENKGWTTPAPLRPASLLKKTLTGKQKKEKRMVSQAVARSSSSSMKEQSTCSSLLPRHIPWRDRTPERDDRTERCLLFPHVPSSVPSSTPISPAILPKLPGLGE
ncbi:hypothetical protein GWK47_022296 [Chionoecetes opilio]|uniref:Uncharacterized protein n=1 Tax=Chionoecetes opilio TaxID=41210 RepID=A0A8J5CHC9_CHIOP|nr:hypothetical protein GWK47_022296 [Chionoecetes opilio]